MTENTYLQAVLEQEKIKTNQELRETFLKTLTIFGNPEPRTDVLIITTSEENIQYGKYGATESVARTKRQLKDMLQQEQKKHENTEFTGINCSGKVMLDSKKYLLPEDSLHVSLTRKAVTYTRTKEGREERKETQLNEPELHWSGQDPSYYGLSGEKRYNENYETFFAAFPKHQKTKIPKISEVVTEVNRIAKQIIREFDPSMLSFCREYGEYLHSSAILYFKNPYLFLFEFPRYSFLVNEEVTKKLKQIKEILSQEKLIALLKKHLEESELFEIIQTGNGGMGIFQRWDKGYSYTLPHAITEIRKDLAKRGVTFKSGDIEVMDSAYHANKKDYLAQERRN